MMLNEGTGEGGAEVRMRRGSTTIPTTLLLHQLLHSRWDGL